MSEQGKEDIEKTHNVMPDREEQQVLRPERRPLQQFFASSFEASTWNHRYHL